MPAQTTQDKIVFPDGCKFEVSTDSGSSWTDMGVLENGATFTHNYDKIEVETGNAGKLKSRVKNQTLELAPSALQSYDPSNWEKFSSGIYTLSTTAGTPVAGASQVVASGDWSFKTGILIENQNNDGSEITVNSVTGGTDGAGAADDYTVIKAAGGWQVVPLDGTNFTTESQTMTIDYDYTPGTSNIITAGTSVTTLERFYARFTHFTDSAYTTYDARLTAYGVDLNSGIQFGMKGANEDGVEQITAAFTANVDNTLTDGAQLMTMEVKSTAYNR